MVTRIQPFQGYQKEGIFEMPSFFCVNPSSVLPLKKERLREGLHKRIFKWNSFMPFIV